MGEAGFRGRAQKKGGLAWLGRGGQAAGQARTGYRTSWTPSPARQGIQEREVFPQ